MSSHAHISSWSDWSWAEEYGQWYRWRINRQNQVIHEYRPPKDVPRTANTDTQDLAQQFSGIDLGSDDASAGAYTHEAEEAPASGSRGENVQRGRRAARSYPLPHEPFYATDHVAEETAPEAVEEDADEDPAALDSSDADTQGVHDAQHNDSAVGETVVGAYDSQVGGYEAAAEDDADEDPDFAAAVRESNNAAYYQSRSGESSSAGGNGSYGLPYAGETYAEEEEEIDDVVTPLQENWLAAPNNRYITGTGRREERLDPRFKVVNSKHFQPGKVLKIFMADPRGHSAHSAKGKATEYTDRTEIRDKFGDNFYVGYRRLVIYATGEGCSYCVPVYTYGRQGCKKHGIKPKKHGIIYQYGKQPQTLPGEPPLGYPPVAVHLHKAGETITKDSRINYAMIYTVQHNVRVLFIGAIDNADLPTVVYAARESLNEAMGG